jgi:hypothetical protein
MTDSVPKAFISYSWSSPGHCDLVRTYAERLLSDGVDVVLDQWDLSEGQDKYAFMEKMVTDASVTHVIIFSDQMYAQKADERKAGVGTESQIISKEVYDKTDQRKFIPVACAKRDDGEPCLPVFLQSRIWIDFSTSERVNENWERLLRVLHGKPFYEKPKLGTPPLYLSDNQNRPSLPTIGRFASLRDALLNSKPSGVLCRQDFLVSAMTFANELRIYQQPSVEEMENKVLDTLRTLLPLRDQFIEWLSIETSLPDESRTEAILVDFLERMLALKCRPIEPSSRGNPCLDAHSIFVYEMFLYLMAILIKVDRPGLIRELLKTRYILPESDARQGKDFTDFEAFRGYSSVLHTRNQRLELNRISLIADLMKGRMQAELVVVLMTVLSKRHKWYPHTLVFSALGAGRFPVFLRATQRKYFDRLKMITGVDSPEELRTKFKEGYEMGGLAPWAQFTWLTDVSLPELMNMDALGTTD